MRTTLRLLVALLAAPLFFACNHDYFTKEGRDAIVAASFPIDTLDPHMDWNLIQEGYVRLTADVAGVSRVQLLSANPFASTQTDVLAERATAEGATELLNYVCRVTQDSIYAMALDADGHPLALTAFWQGSTTANFSREHSMAGNYVAPEPQRIYYCFEEDFPNIGDWDYNDLVMSITATPTDDVHTVTLSVTLEAAGTLNQVAAAIRLVGVGYDAVAIETDRDFFPNFTYPRQLIPDEGLVQRAKTTGEAVLTLFDDAHLAFRNRVNEGGLVNRYYFNTSHDAPTSGNRVFNIGSVTRNFRLTFADSTMAKSFTLGWLDPFIIHFYNIGIWEVHTYPYKFAEVFYEDFKGRESDYDDGYAWALAVPYSWFRYPEEGTPMGYFRDGVFSGAYLRLPQAFGLWIKDCSQAREWYLHPSTGAVY